MRFEDVLSLSVFCCPDTVTAFSVCQKKKRVPRFPKPGKRSLNRLDRKEIAFLLNQRLFIQTMMGHAESCLTC